MSDLSPPQTRRRFLPTPFSSRFWVIFALCGAIVLTVASYFWIVAHPHPLNWDEAYYLNRVSGDVWTLDNLGKREFVKALFYEDPARPPLYRILAWPSAILFGARPFALRLTSLFFFWVSLGLIFLTTRRFGGAAAGAFAILFLSLCPRVFSPTKIFLTEYGLYLTLAATLYFLLRDWGREAQPNSRSWIGLGIALGLGALAKLTFIAIVAPTILCAAILSGFGIVRSPSVGQLAKACGLGFVILAPWWLLNYQHAWGFARFSSSFTISSVGQKGELGTIAKWLGVVVQSGLGIPVALLVLAICISFGIQLARKRVRFDRTQLAALGVCLAGCLPLVLLAASGNNHNPRLIAPAFFPFAILLGTIAAEIGWLTSKVLGSIALALLTAQLVFTVAPSPGAPRYKSDAAVYYATPWRSPKMYRLLWVNPGTVMLHQEQWDWGQLRELCQQRQLPQPKVATLGSIDTINEPQINFPWVQAGQSIEVVELWRATSGEAIDWQKVMEMARDSDVVVTQPIPKNLELDGVASADSQHNKEFIARLRADPHFEQPIPLKMGRFDPVRIFVFFHKDGEGRQENADDGSPS